MEIMKDELGDVLSDMQLQGIFNHNTVRIMKQRMAKCRVQSCCTYSDEATSSDDEPAGMYS